MSAGFSAVRVPLSRQDFRDHGVGSLSYVRWQRTSTLKMDSVEAGRPQTVRSEVLQASAVRARLFLAYRPTGKDQCSSPLALTLEMALERRCMYLGRVRSG